MVDVGENLGGKFVFIVSFLGIFVILVASMPSGFYVSAPDYEGRDYPDYWSAEDIKSIVFWGNTTVTYEYSWHYLKIDRSPNFDDIDIRIYWYTYKPGENGFYFERYWYQWGWWLQIQQIKPYPLSELDVRDNIDETGNFSRFEMHCNSFNYITYFGFNQTTYSSLEDALDNQDIIISMGMGWDYESGALSGWDLIGRLLFFQVPDIHPILNAIIALPIWAMISYLTFSLIMRIIKALPFT